VELLQQECAKEKKQKLQAEATAGDLVVEVAGRQAEIAHLNGETSKLQDQVNGKTLLALTILSKFLAGLLMSLACV
jgi:hypothetical protein